jgi:hypothetical protein
MGMGIVSDKEFDSELSKISPSRAEINSPKVQPKVIEINRGRGNGNVEVPESLRKIIGEESQINGRASGIELSKQFGISPSSVSAYANGATSTSSYNNPNPEISNHISNAKEHISTRARSKLMRAIGHITDEKLKGAKATELSTVAKDMSAVIRNMEPERDKGNTQVNGPTFVFYAPQQRKEETYDIIYAKE